MVLGVRNSRIKDFFDLYHLAQGWEFDRVKLSDSVRRTFARRRTPVPRDEPVGLTAAYWQNPSRPAQVRAFARRARLQIAGVPEAAFLALLGSFLNPILDDLRYERQQAGVWRPGGPWS